MPNPFLPMRLSESTSIITEQQEPNRSVNWWWRKIAQGKHHWRVFCWGFFFFHFIYLQNKASGRAVGAPGYVTPRWLGTSAQTWVTDTFLCPQAAGRHAAFVHACLLQAQSAVITSLNVGRVSSRSFKDTFGEINFIHYMQFGWEKCHIAKPLSPCVLKYELKTKDLVTL